MSEEIQDKSLLRCTIKKSASVTGKLIVYAGGAVIGIVLIVLAFYGLIGLFVALIEPITTILNVISAGIVFVGSAAVALVSAIPWYGYLLLGVVAAIFGYSLIWCLVRDLTPEDYADKDVNGVMDAVTASLFFIALASVPLCIVLAVIGNMPIGLTTVGLALIAFAASVEAWDTKSEVGVRSVCYTMFRVLPAYYVKSKKNKIQKEETS